MALSASMAAFAVPAMPGLRPVMQADGTVVYVERVGDESMHLTIDADGALLRCVDGMYRYADLLSDGRLVDSDTPVIWTDNAVKSRIDNIIGMRMQQQEESASAVMRVPAVGLSAAHDFPAKGHQKTIVILVEYQDLKFTLEDSHTYFADMLNKEGFSDPVYGGTGSCRDYFLESSMGQFDPEFDLFGPVTLSKPRSYYGGNDATGQEPHAYEMVLEACQMLDAEVDFSEYDRNNDGVIDNVFVFYAGQGEATYGPEESVWPHSSLVPGAHMFDGVRLNSYGCTNEWEQTRPDGIGTFCHEFSHVLGLPDLYNTVKITTYTPGYWSVLDYGPYNNSGRTPPAYSTFERNALGWIDIKELEPVDSIVELPDLRTSNVGYGRTNPKKNEFYLFENRQQEGSDLYLPSHGMLVWHVEYVASRWYYNNVNNNDAHQYVDLIEANGRTSGSTGNDGDPFPGSTERSRLNMKWWSGENVGICLRDITETDGNISFRVVAPLTDVNADFMTVDQVIESAGEEVDDARVRGYIVGYLKSGNMSARTATFSAGTSKTNVLLADSPDETSWCDCVVAQLVINTEPRNALNLADNPHLLGKYVEVTGTVADYLGYRGVKAVSDYKILDPSSIGSVETDNGGSGTDACEWFTIQGRKIGEPEAPGVYIRRSTAGSEKIIIR